MNILFSLQLRDRSLRSDNVTFYLDDYIASEQPKRWQILMRSHLLDPHIQSAGIDTIINQRADLFAYNEDYGNGNRAKRRLLIMFDQGQLSSATIIQAQMAGYLPFLDHPIANWPKPHNSNAVGQ